MFSVKDAWMEAVGRGFEFDIEDLIFAAEMGGNWSPESGELLKEDDNFFDSHEHSHPRAVDDRQDYFFPSSQSDQRRERINAYLAREEGGCIG